MRAMSQRSILLAITALAVMFSLGLLVWISASIREKPVVATARIVSTRETEPAESSSPVATPEIESNAPSRTEIAKPAASKPIPSAAPAAAATSSAKDGVTLVARFVRPDFKEIEVAHATIELSDMHGGVHRASVDRKSFARFTNLAPESYVVRVTAQELEHREETLDLVHANDAKKGQDGEVVVVQRVVLWPAEWAAVIVETNDGRPFSALAVDLGYTPMHLFVGAFHARAQLDPPDARSKRAAGAASLADASSRVQRDGTASFVNAPTTRSPFNAGADPALADAPPSDKDLVRFHPPPEHKSWELSKSCVGSLELVHAPPMWVGLDLFGRPLGWELLAPGAHEVVFRIDRAALEDRFARLTVRVIDAQSRAPVADALVTLRADNSSHRRPDLTNVASDADGGVELVNVVPGRYELSVARGDAQFQRMIQLERAERRNLGDVALGESRALEVEVVDDRGEPATAFVEIGPYEKGARSVDLYPRMMRHQASRGHAKVPMPSERAILRAAIEMGRGNGPTDAQEVHGVRSANVLLDPRSSTSSPLRLVLQKPVKMRVTTSRRNSARVEVLDELDLVVARSIEGRTRELEVELVPGRYRARTVAPDGTASFEVPFTADGTQSEIAID
jgi:hypothetical protein